MFIKGDIHNVIKSIEDNSIDLIYTDPPFQITNASWDKGVDWKYLFPDMWRVLKPTGIIVLYASMPFTYELLKYEKPKYHYTWIKNNSTGFLTTKYQPLRRNEEVFIYYKKAGTDEHIDYFIKTYSNEGDKILDMTCCYGYVGKRCDSLKRNYIGVDLNI